MPKVKEDHTAYVKREFSDKLVGRKIVLVRQMNDQEMQQLYWEPSYGDVPIVIQLDDNTLVVPMQDPEGNGPGFLDIQSPE